MMKYVYQKERIIPMLSYRFKIPPRHSRTPRTSLTSAGPGSSEETFLISWRPEQLNSFGFTSGVNSARASCWPEHSDSY